jgi:hypothetical protein
LELIVPLCDNFESLWIRFKNNELDVAGLEIVDASGIEMSGKTDDRYGVGTEKE